VTATSICKHETQSKWADEEEDEGCAVFQSGRSLVSCTNVPSPEARARIRPRHTLAIFAILCYIGLLLRSAPVCSVSTLLAALLKHPAARHPKWRDRLVEHMRVIQRL